VIAWSPCGVEPTISRTASQSIVAATSVRASANVSSAASVEAREVICYHARFRRAVLTKDLKLIEASSRELRHVQPHHRVRGISALYEALCSQHDAAEMPLPAARRYGDPRSD
jgi:hypothetical protein